MLLIPLPVFVKVGQSILCDCGGVSAIYRCLLPQIRIESICYMLDFLTMWLFIYRCILSKLCLLGRWLGFCFWRVGTLASCPRTFSVSAPVIGGVYVKPWFHV